MITSLVKLS